MWKGRELLPSQAASVGSTGSIGSSTALPLDCVQGISSASAHHCALRSAQHPLPHPRSMPCKWCCQTGTQSGTQDPKAACTKAGQCGRIVQRRAG